MDEKADKSNPNPTPEGRSPAGEELGALCATLRDEVVRLTNAVVKSAHSELATVRSDCVALCLRAERILRVYNIVNSKADQEFSVALWWFSEQGDIDDIKLLQQMKDSHRFTADQIRLIDFAKATIVQRLIKERRERESAVRSVHVDETLIWCMLTLCAATLAFALIFLSDNWFRFALAFSSGILGYECIIVVRKIRKKLVTIVQQEIPQWLR